MQVVETPRTNGSFLQGTNRTSDSTLIGQNLHKTALQVARDQKEFPKMEKLEWRAIQEIRRLAVLQFQILFQHLPPHLHALWIYQRVSCFFQVHERCDDGSDDTINCPAITEKCALIRTAKILPTAPVNLQAALKKEVKAVHFYPIVHVQLHLSSGT